MEFEKEFRIFGPPGTGKTTALATKYVPGSIKKYGRENVMITSFTRAAAREIATKRSRETGERISLPHSHVGTLHQICFHALGQPVITETSTELLDDWNNAYPPIALSKRTSQMDELYVDEATGKEQGGLPKKDLGDKLFAVVNRKRNRMTDPKIWQESEQKFYKKWKDFKAQTMSIDFTDLIESGLEMTYAPDRPRVLYVDEAQDFTPLQLEVCRRWGQEMDYVVLVGDDDQAIYSFTGASPDAFLNPPIDKNRKEVLTQSWRVPQRVLQVASRLIQPITHREIKNYKPRFDLETGKTVQGLVIQSDGTYKAPEKMMPSIEGDLAQGKSVMILGTCSYHLSSVKKLLRNRALPFGNRYRRTRRDWNPLNNKSTKMVLSFMGTGIDKPYWNVPQLLDWATEIKVDNESGLKRKVGKKVIDLLKDAVANEEEGTHTTRYVLDQLFAPNAVQKALDRDLEWFKKQLKKPYDQSTRYPIKVHQTHGANAIEDEPKITIGTVHSVKGGEADSVYLFPDISVLANKAYVESQSGKDSILRVFYVGMTRAKEKLTVCTPGISTKYMRKTPHLYVPLL